MKKILIVNVLALIFVQTTLFCQGGLLLDNAQIVCVGTIKIVVENGRWQNTGGTFTKGNSTVKLAGNASAANSVIEGDVTTFHDLEIAKSQNNVKILSSSVIVSNLLRFTSRNLDLNGKTVVLGTGFSSGNLTNENTNSYTYSALPLSSVTKTSSISNPSNAHFGGMGMRITATGSFGNTTLDRRHNAQTLPTGDGIQKYWRLSTTNNPAGQNATLRFQYFDSELNGNNEADLTIWRSTNNGASWTDMGFATRSSTSNYVEQIALSDINGWWTLGVAPPAPVVGPGGERDENNPASVASTWNVFPNPFAEWVTVSIHSQTKETVVFECCTAEGKVVLSTPIALEIGENTFQFDLKTLPTGRYFARMVGLPCPAIALVKGSQH